jgi:hypothetical protein
MILNPGNAGRVFFYSKVYFSNDCVQNTNYRLGMFGNYPAQHYLNPGQNVIEG